MTNHHQILNQIIENKRAEIEAIKSAQPIELLREVVEISHRDFRTALSNGKKEPIPKLIAEFKRKSPSQKTILVDSQVEKIINIYNHHATAISVLTDHKFFGGSLEDLNEADQSTHLPLLRKDFILDEYQLYEARQFGADAVLLIARILNLEELEKLLTESKKLGLDCLVEIHSEEDLKKVLQTSADIIGINNRNLDSLEINLETTFDLAEKIPADKIIVSESGISTRDELEKLSGKVDAVLIGTAILREEDIESKLVELSHG
jgi:indole-3-glycerol phosphate synthase